MRSAALKPDLSFKKVTQSHRLICNVIISALKGGLATNTLKKVLVDSFHIEMLGYCGEPIWYFLNFSRVPK